MAEDNEGALVVFPEAFGNVAAPLKTPFLKTLGQLLGGLTAIPAAWLKRPVQAYEDTTTGRSQVADALAKAVAEQAVGDPEIMQAATELYLPAAIKKGRNKVQVALRAAEHVRTEAGDTSNSATPDEDWLNLFARFAEDASSERLQDLFARILAGEVVRPGSFGAATLRAVSELDQSIASDFTMAWAKALPHGSGISVDYAPYFQRGEGFSLWKRLSEAGLMAHSDVVQYPPSFDSPNVQVQNWSPMRTDSIFLVVHIENGSTSRWANIPFTKTGCQIGSILPTPDYETNMREAAQRFPTERVRQIDLLLPGRRPERLR